MAAKPLQERRRFPRPPLWLNLLLIILALGTFVFAQRQRDEIDTKTAVLFTPSKSNPAELNQVRDELSQMDVTEGQLKRELDARMEYLKTVDSEQFYLSVDTAKKKLALRLGKDVVRESDIEVGEGRTVKSGTKSWTFVPLKGAFTVTDKKNNYGWVVSEWAYAMRGEPLPAVRANIPNGLGAYVVFLPDGYLIQSPPPATSPLAGRPKPGSIMIPEADLAAMWPRIIPGQTRVYIF
ncbi:MAG TPA: hypothetical protein VGJ82_11410 [Thermoanaerobaculia bacterium]